MGQVHGLTTFNKESTLRRTNSQITALTPPKGSTASALTTLHYAPPSEFHSLSYNHMKPKLPTHEHLGDTLNHNAQRNVLGIAFQFS